MKLNKIFFIAEAGVNHNGNMEIARKMVDEAVSAGADAVKFQNFKAELLAQKGLEKEEYQKNTSGSEEDQFQMLKKLELSSEDTAMLRDYCRGKKTEFISTPYDYESVDLLEKLGVEKFKVAAGELTDTEFLKYIARKNKPVIISTGAGTLDEVDEAVDSVKDINSDFALLQCTSAYPAPLSDVNLNAMKAMKIRYNCTVGYSDHTPGNAAAVLSVAAGAEIIEKHFTLDRNMDGPDHKASMEPGELKTLIEEIRNAEMIMGSPEKKPSASESETIRLGRRSILSALRIKKGDVVKREMLITKRPASGIPPSKITELIGKRALRNIEYDEILSMEDFE